MPMRISKTKVLGFLMRCQIERGGYTGNDIAKLAKNRIAASPEKMDTSLDIHRSDFPPIDVSGTTNDSHYSGRLRFNQPAAQRKAFGKDVRHPSRDKR